MESIYHLYSNSNLGKSRLRVFSVLPLSLLRSCELEFFLFKFSYSFSFDPAISNNLFRESKGFSFHVNEKHDKLIIIIFILHHKKFWMWGKPNNSYNSVKKLLFGFYSLNIVNNSSQKVLWKYGIIQFFAFVTRKEVHLMLHCRKNIIYNVAKVFEEVHASWMEKNLLSEKTHWLENVIVKSFQAVKSDRLLSLRGISWLWIAFYLQFLIKP